MKGCSLWQWGLAGSLTILVTTPTLAQITPDGTLPNNSTVRQDIIKGLPSDVIEGGTQRGGNLFHSFSDFNVDEGRGAYFANPAGIDNILSRVTGGNPSLIFGTLGVLGGANLYFLNPSGIFFGSNSKLDIQGSFIGTTADGIYLGDEGSFNASEPQKSNLLSINPGVLFFNQVAQQPGNILVGEFGVDKGVNWSVKGDLTLAAGKITIESGLDTETQLTAGKNFTLQGSEITINGQFKSGVNFQVEGLDGNLGSLESVDGIVIRSSGDVSMLSYIGGSLHILAGGNVEIPGFIQILYPNFFGLKEDVTLSNGTVISIDGQNQPTVDIRVGVKQPENTVTPTNADINVGTIFFEGFDDEGNFIPITGTILLTNQYQPNPNLTGNIQGIWQLGNDLEGVEIRNSSAEGGGLVIIDSNGNISFDGAINVSTLDLSKGSGGNITLLAEEKIDLTKAPLISQGIQGGQITLNSNSGSINTGLIDAGGISKGEFVSINASGGIEIGENIEVSSNGNGGDVNLTAGGNIEFVEGSSLISQGLYGGTIVVDGNNISIRAIDVRGVNSGGSVTLNADDGIQINGDINASAANGNGGNVNLTAQGDINSTPNLSIFSQSQIGTGGQITFISKNGNINIGFINTIGKLAGGSVTLDASGNIQANGNINVSSSNGNSGNVNLTAKEDITFNSGSSIVAQGIGLRGGQVMLDGRNVTIRAIDVRGNESGGSVTINAKNGIQINGDIDASAANCNGGNVNLTAQGDINSAPNLSIFSQSQADSGQITLTSKNGNINIGSFDTEGFLNGGSVTLNAFGNIQIYGVIDEKDKTVRAIDVRGNQNGGAVTLDAGGSIQANGNINVSSSENGNAGNVNLTAERDINLTQTSLLSVGKLGGQIRLTSKNANISVDLIDTRGNQNGGSVTLDSQNGNINISSINTAGNQNGGSVLLDAGGNIQANGNINTSSSDGNGNQIRLTSKNGNISVNAIDTVGKLGGGSVALDAGNNIQANGNINVSSSQGNAGNVHLTAGGDINSSSSVLSVGQVGGQITLNSKNGNISINAIDTEGVLGGGSVSLDAGGNIQVNGNINVSAEPNENESPIYKGNGGDVTLLANGNFTFSPNVFITSFGLLGGNITLNSGGKIALTNGLIASSSYTNEPNLQGGKIDVTARSLVLTESAQIITSTFGVASSGDLIVSVPESIEVIGTTRFDELSPDRQNPSALWTIVGEGATGDSGDLIIKTGRLVVGDGGQVGSLTDAGGMGNSGNTTIKAAEIEVFGVIDRTPFPASIATIVQPDATQNSSSGHLTIETGRLTIRDGGLVGTGTFGNGHSGNTTINAKTIEVFGFGTTSDSQNFSSSIFTVVGFGGTGTSGNLTLNTDHLIVRDGGQILTGTRGSGNSGNLDIRATTLEVLRTASIPQSSNSIIQSPSSILTVVSPDVTGNSGNITLNTERLSVRDGGKISASGAGIGTVGNLTVKNAESVELVGTARLGDDVSNQILPAPSEDQQGNLSQLINRLQLVSLIEGQKINDDLNNNPTEFPSGLSASGTSNIDIDTRSLLMRNGAQIFTNRSGIGGNIGLTSRESVEIVGKSSNSELSSGIVTSITPQAIEQDRGGNLSIETQRLIIRDSAFIDTGTSSSVLGGNLKIRASESVELTFGRLLTSVGREATGRGGDIDIQTGTLTLDENSQINARTLGRGDAGNITVTVDGLLRSTNSSITASVDETATGRGGNIDIQAGTLTLDSDARINARSLGQGDAGNINLAIDKKLQVTNSEITVFARQALGGDINIDTATLTLDNSIINAQTFGAKDAGNINLTSDSLALNNSQITAQTFGQGNSGKIAIAVDQLIQATDSSIVVSAQQAAGGDIDIKSDAMALNNSQITAQTFGQGNAGKITIAIDRTFNTTNNSRITTSAQQAIGGDIDIKSDTMTLENSQVNAQTFGQGNAGNITFKVDKLIQITNSDVTASAAQASGGKIDMIAQNIQLDGNSNIRTDVSRGTGGGGNITLKADTITAFDDSNIIASARDGKGGDITLDTPVFLGEGYQQVRNANQDKLEDNGQVDINASGGIQDGTIRVPNLNNILNSLVKLPTQVVDTQKLLARSCIAPSQDDGGKFIITGANGLPENPGGNSISTYPTEEVRTVSPNDSSSRSWKLGDPIIEPQGVYHLSNGQVVLSRECQ